MRPLLNLPVLTLPGGATRARWRRLLAAWLACVSCIQASSTYPPDADDGGLTLPPGFRALVFADNLVVERTVAGRANNLRFLAVAANGDVYAKTKRGGLLALRDTDGDGRADVVRDFGEGGGTDLQFHDQWLYHSTDKAVLRYRHVPGELVPTGAPEAIVVDLPNQRTHESKSFFFDDAGGLFVQIGAPSNGFGGENDRRAGARGSDASEYLRTYGGFWRFDAGRAGQTQVDGYRFSTGHRNVVGVAWRQESHAAFFVMHGRDNLSDVAPEHFTSEDNAELPAEEFHRLAEGMNLGWPYTYFDPRRRARMIAPEFGGDGRTQAEPGLYADPLIAFPAHWAPMQLAFYSGAQFPARYRGGAFLAFHGSWNRAPHSQRGYHVVFIPFRADGQPIGTWEVFADGFAGRKEFTSPRDARYRPCGVAVGPDGSLYLGETEKGRIWRIIHTGESGTRPSAQVEGREDPAPATDISVGNARGRALYTQWCAACHMADGRGVPALQPSLLESTVVRGDPSLLARTILAGPAVALAADRPAYSNIMPSYGALLDDAQTADLINYLRQAFGGQAGDFTVEQAAAARR